MLFIISLDFIGCMGRMSFVYKSIYNKMKEKGYEIKRYDYPVLSNNGFER